MIHRIFRGKNRIRKEEKKHHFFKLRYILFLFLFYVAFDTTYNYLLSSSLKISNEDFLNLLISESNHYINYKDKPHKIINEAIALLSNININKPTSILGINFIDKKNDAIAVSGTVTEDNYNPNEMSKITDYIKDPNPSDVSKPLVYIYNSHQLEDYNAKGLEIYNIKPNVMMASYLLKEKLNNLSIPAIVEIANLTDFMQMNNWAQADSYKASRIFILDAKNKYDSLKYFIDIHRDSVNGNVSTTTINGKRYAKLMFVVGLDNPSYKSNLEVTNAINNIVVKKYPGLSRGVLKKQGAGVNGVYNQDISPRVMAIEIGGVDNNIEEVMNTVEALSNILYQYIRSGTS